MFVNASFLTGAPEREGKRGKVGGRGSIADLARRGGRGVDLRPRPPHVAGRSKAKRHGLGNPVVLCAL